MHLPWSLFLFLNAALINAYDAPPRWGQAAVVVNDVLYVYGGKTDEFNEFSYTSAPNTNDILYLSLASSFEVSAPPWSAVSGTHNESSQQGPALAWHTASAYNTSQIIVFGGLPDVNSDTNRLGEPDSAIILDVWDRLGPIWAPQPSSWANQPARRIRHSTATIPSGLVFIFGGERADGSGTALSDNYVFDPTVPSFTQLSSENGPPDLVGHVSIPLPDGRILVFGGYIPSERILLLMSTIYVLDTTRTPYSWSLLQVSSGSLPNARRAFAATLVAPTRILIHGGSDAYLQTTLDDGWLLDLSQPEAVWTRVDSLSGVGPRRDHFAVSSGDNVLFGFGYAQSSPASEPVQVFNLPGSSLVPTFTPRPPSQTPFVTLPPFTSTPTTRPSPTPTNSPSNADPNNPSPTNNPGDGNDNDDKPDTPAEAEAKKDRTTKIAVSTSLGVLALVAIVLGTLYYRHKKQRRWEENRFWVIDGDDHAQGHFASGPHLEDDDSQFNRDIPLAGAKAEPGMSELGHGTSRGGGAGVLGALGLASLTALLRGGGTDTAKTRNSREVSERRNMLDDEDNADFGTWYNARKKEGTGGSSWSLMSIIARGRGNRESASSTPWREKGDPFGDGTSVTLDEETGMAVATSSASARPRARREHSHVSSLSAYSYTDPFSDPIQEEPRHPSESSTAYQDHDPSTSSGIRLLSGSGLPPIRTTLLPLTDFTGHALSPLSEKTSQSTLPLHDGGSSLGSRSSEHILTPFSSLKSRTTSHTTPGTTGTGESSGSGASGGMAKSPTLLSGLLPAPHDDSIKRSDSWWSRLARRASDASGRSNGNRHSSFVARGGMDIRDPNPPPTTRLSMIVERTTPEKESQQSTPSAGADSRQSSAGVAGLGSAAVGPENKEKLYTKARHGKSMSSVRTADSEAIERMAGTMEVAQRLASEDATTEDGGAVLLSRRGRGSLSSKEMSIDERYSEEEDDMFSTEVVASPLEMEYRRVFPTPHGGVVDERASTGHVKAPVPVRPGLGSRNSSNLLVPLAKGSNTPPSPGSASPSSRASSARASPRPLGPRTSISGPSESGAPRRESVAARVKALESGKRLTSPAVGERGSRHMSVDYGLVPRRSLFIVNPDNKRTSIGSEESR